MKFDMHLHTREGSPDGMVSLADSVSRLKELGFGGLLTADHDTYNGYRQWKYNLKDKEQSGFVVLKGIEYDTYDLGHFLVIMPVGMKLRVLEERGMPAAALIKLVHHYGGILGPAHPFGERYLSALSTMEAARISEARIRNIVRQFDFLEIYNACETDGTNSKAQALAEEYHIPGTGGSDAHRRECVGMGWAELPDGIRNENDLIAYIRQRPVIECGGQFYSKTVRDRLGYINILRLGGFFVYNKLFTAGRTYRRRNSGGCIRPTGEKRRTRISRNIRRILNAGSFEKKLYMKQISVI